MPIKPHIRHPEDAARQFTRMTTPPDIEVTQALFLRDNGQLVAHRILATGDTDSTWLPISQILRIALTLDARKLVLAHNHPGASPEPSMQDLYATYRLIEAASAVGIRVEDHIILNGQDYRSMAAMGLLRGCQPGGSVPGLV
jgi:DNA repair protein RadC